MTDGLHIELIKQSLQPQNVEDSRRTQSSSNAGKGGQSSASSQLQLSPQAQDVRVAQQTIRSLPDVRQEKIQELKRQLASGQVNVIPEILSQTLLAKIFPPK